MTGIQRRIPAVRRIPTDRAQLSHLPSPPPSSPKFSSQVLLTPISDTHNPEMQCMDKPSRELFGGGKMLASILTRSSWSNTKSTTQLLGSWAALNKQVHRDIHCDGLAPCSVSAVASFLEPAGIFVILRLGGGCNHKMVSVGDRANQTIAGAVGTANQKSPGWHQPLSKNPWQVTLVPMRHHGGDPCSTGYS